MDPDANLEKTRKLVSRLIKAIDFSPDEGEGFSFDTDDVNTLLDMIQSLDRWLSKGGFLPADWAKGR